ncbi:helix-turn-helix transcriptional regulator [Lysinibacillus sp. NPDC047702]|uniref:AraC family transcriptional regulator n=1 Tax=unclassified Lysinibacillus TaxID=2636778 RepID=UPI003CFFEEE9
MKVDFHQNFIHFYHALEILNPQEISQDNMAFQSNVKAGAIHRLSPRQDLEVVVSDYSFYKEHRMDILTAKPMVEVSFCLQGTRGVRISDCAYEITAGTCSLQFIEQVEASFLFNKNESYQMVGIGIPVSTFNRYMNKIDGNDGSFMNFHEVLKGASYRLFQEKIDAIDTLILQQMLHAIAAKKMTNLELEYTVLQLLMRTFQTFLNQPINLTEFSTSDREKIRQAQVIIIENMMNPPSLMELSRLIGLNDFKLKKGFKEMFGTTVFGYLREKRLEKASYLLQNGSMNVTEVANAVGYSNPSHFAAAFKGKYGINPREVLRKFSQPFIKGNNL